MEFIATICHVNKVPISASKKLRHFAQCILSGGSFALCIVKWSEANARCGISPFYVNLSSSAVPSWSWYSQRTVTDQKRNRNGLQQNRNKLTQTACIILNEDDIFKCNEPIQSRKTTHKLELKVKYDFTDVFLAG